MLMLVLKGHTNSVQALAYTPDGQSLISAGDDRTIRVWDLGSLGERAVFLGQDEDEGILTLAVSFDGELLVAGGFDRRVHLWNLRTTQRVGPPIYYHEYVYTVGLSPDGSLLAIGGNRRDQQALQLVRLKTGKRHNLDSGSPPVVSERGTGHAVWSLAFAPDGGILAVGWGNGTVELLELAPFNLIHPFPHSSGVFGLSFSPDGTLLATLSAETVRLWDVSSRRLLRELGQHGDRAYAVAFSPDGQSLATAGWDSTVRLWDPVTSQERARFDWELGRRINALAFSPDGLTAAAGGDSPDIVIWDMDTL